MTAVSDAVAERTGRETKRAALPLYFGPDAAGLFGWFHPGKSAPGPVMVICPPLGYPMIMSHRGLRHLAEAAAEAGMPTLRFDYHGTGDSSGSDYEPGRVDAWLASVDHAVDEARRLTGAQGVVLAGVRVGCLLAAYAASGRSDITGLIAWAPVMSGRTQVRELRAVEQLMRGYEPRAGELPDGAIMAAGFMFSQETIMRLGELDIRRLDRAPSPRALVIPRDDLPDDDRFAQALERLGTAVTRASHAGFSGMMRDAHATLVPDDAIKGIVQWASDLDATASPLAARPPGRPVLHRVASGAAYLGLEAPTQLAHELVEEPLQGADGRLFGILTRPSNGTAPGRPAIILASAGAVHRIGANRLYVTMARAWAEHGFPVLRLDIGGIGDSLPFPGMPENDTYSARAVADIAEAAAALPKECTSAGVVVAGLCSGAHAAFHSALTLEGIVGIIMMNPIVFYWKPSDALEVSDWMSHKEVRRYQQNVTRLDSWRRVLQGKVDLLQAARTVGVWIRSRVQAHGQALLRGVTGETPAGSPEHDVVRDITRLCHQGVDVCLVFSTDEPGLSQLETHYSDALDRLKLVPRFTYHEIGWPGHTFTSAGAQQTLVRLLTEHLRQAFPAGPAWAFAPQAGLAVRRESSNSSKCG
jgi:alpha/beta superfamily hydrolase